MTDETEMQKAFLEIIGISFDASCRNYDNRIFAQGFQDGWQAAIAHAAQKTAPEHTVPPGWRLVPEEPTEKMMMHKATCQHHDPFDMTCVARSNRMRIYKAMLAAAPKPEETK